MSKELKHEKIHGRPKNGDSAAAELAAVDETDGSQGSDIEGSPSSNAGANADSISGVTSYKPNYAGPLQSTSEHEFGHTVLSPEPTKSNAQNSYSAQNPTQNSAQAKTHKTSDQSTHRPLPHLKGDGIAPNRPNLDDSNDNALTKPDQSNEKVVKQSIDSVERTQFGGSAHTPNLHAQYSQDVDATKENLGQSTLEEPEKPQGVSSSATVQSVPLDSDIHTIQKDQNLEQPNLNNPLTDQIELSVHESQVNQQKADTDEVLSVESQSFDYQLTSNQAFEIHDSNTANFRPDQSTLHIRSQNLESDREAEYKTRVENLSVSSASPIQMDKHEHALSPASGGGGVQKTYKAWSIENQQAQSHSLGAAQSASAAAAYEAADRAKMHESLAREVASIDAKLADATGEQREQLMAERRAISEQQQSSIKSYVSQQEGATTSEHANELRSQSQVHQAKAISARNKAEQSQEHALNSQESNLGNQQESLRQEPSKANVQSVTQGVNPAHSRMLDRADKNAKMSEAKGIKEAPQESKDRGNSWEQRSQQRSQEMSQSQSRDRPQQQSTQQYELQQQAEFKSKGQSAQQSQEQGTPPPPPPKPKPEQAPTVNG